MTDQQQGKARGVVDIVFLLDVTGSMQPCIDALKENISTFIDVLTSPGPNNTCPVRDWRAKVVGYRDYDEHDFPPFEDAPFVRDPGELKLQLARLHADGGGDEPESLLDAIFKLATMGQTDKGAQIEDPAKWRYRSTAARVVVVFTDATYKEPLRLPEASGGGLDDVANAVMANRIILSIFAPDLPCYDALSAIDKSEFMPIAVDGLSPQAALAEFTADRENFKQTLMQLARSVSKSADTPTL